MINTAIIYNHRGRFGKDGTAPVEVRVTIDRRAYYINTGVRVRAKEFKFGHVVNVGQADALNERIGDMLGRVDAMVNECLQTGRKIDVAEIRRRVWSPDARRKLDDAGDMLAWCEDQVERANVSDGTKRHYRTTLTRLKEYGELRKWSDLSVDAIRRWDVWLHGIKKHQTDVDKSLGKPAEYIGQGAVHNYHKNLKALLTVAIKCGIIPVNPYDRLQGDIKRGDKETVEYLTDAEVAAIESLTLDEGRVIAAVRDIFLFQCRTGMSYSDVMVFSLDKCERNGERWNYSAPRIKTGVWFYIQILPQALAIVERYGGRLPRVADEVCNRHLKELAKRAGITKRLTTHVGRHTFATWALHRGVPIERVSKMLGHKNIKLTQRYAKVIAQDVYGEFEKLR